MLILERLPTKCQSDRLYGNLPISTSPVLSIFDHQTQNTKVISTIRKFQYLRFKEKSRFFWYTWLKTYIPFPFFIVFLKWDKWQVTPPICWHFCFWWLKETYKPYYILYISSLVKKHFMRGRIERHVPLVLKSQWEIHTIFYFYTLSYKDWVYSLVKEKDHSVSQTTYVLFFN